ncbi:MAG: lysostaphin resistance A-like protein [Planctomycetaceae bacterium]
MQAAGAEAVAAVDPALETVVVAGICVALVASVAAATWIAGRLRRGLPVIERRPRPPATWRGGDVAVIALAYVGLLAGAATVLGEKPPLRLQLVADMVTKSAATLVGLGVLHRAGASWAASGFAGGRWWDDLRIAGVGLALVLAPLLALAAVLDRIVSYRHSIVTFLQGHRDPVDVALVALAAVVVAPIAEEFFFRRALQGWLEVRLPEADGAAAIGLSAAAFAAAHVGQGLAPAPLFLLGIVLGLIAHRTGSLVPCSLLHAAFNAVGVGLLLAAPPVPPGGC